jgi:uncharacterized protein (DUF2252 family)
MAKTASARTTAPRPRRPPARETPQVTPEERVARGKAARREVPRESHADYQPGGQRPDPIGIIDAQSADRGAAAIMASDLAGTPRSGIHAQLCGDAHMLNFRLLASPERQLIFDINDFDETLPGPWEWDVKRLSASLVIAGRQNGFADKERAAVVRTAVASYRQAMRAFAAMRHLDVWYARADVARIQADFASYLTKGERQRLSAVAAKAKRRDSLQAFSKLTTTVDGRREIVSDPPLIERLDDLLPDDDRDRLIAAIMDAFEVYARSLQTDRRWLFEQFRYVDMARKVVGVGSVGTRCWIILMLGRDGQDPLLLQVKEASKSVLAEHVGASEYDNQGQRVAAGQRLMQAASDIMLGWTRATGIDGARRDFYVRQMLDWKGIAVAEAMNPRAMQWFGELCGTTLARAHARSGDRIAIAAYLGGGDAFDRALVRFAEAYADQNERDHQALLDAVKTGRVTAAATTA